ncbi:MAG TPA: hypothetical protein VMA31_08425 [Bryobacteraceae bacterium]|nr:hypothetical protein [Bryobacteraceae bacterium]
MGWKDLKDKAQELANTATDVAGKAVDEFNEALPTLRGLGFTVKDLRVGMGLVPEIGAKLVASTDTVDPKKIKELMEKNPENKVLSGALKALLAAYNIKQEIGDIPFKGVEVDVTLSLPPHIAVGFVSAAPAAAAASGAAKA